MSIIKEIEEVKEYIRQLGDKPNQNWQVEVVLSLRRVVFETIPNVEERLQYGKPHYLKNGHYAAVISASKDKVSFMVFNASKIAPINNVLRPMGNSERKTLDIRDGQQVDYPEISEWLRVAAETL